MAPVLKLFLALLSALTFVSSASILQTQAVPDFSPGGCLDPPGGIATFRPIVEELEKRDPFPGYSGKLPRGIHQMTYAGTSVWNSQGMNVTQAARAMLGDPFAYFETALFTVYKMVLLNQTEYLPDLIHTVWCETAGQTTLQSVVQWLRYGR